VPAALVVGELHHIIVETFLIIAANVEDIDEPGVILRDFFVFLNPFKLTLKSPLELKVLAAHHLHGPVHARDRAPQIDFSVGTSADAAEELEVGDQGAVGCPGDTEV